MKRGNWEREDILRATTATVRAISQEPEAGVCGDDGASRSTEMQVMLRPLPPRPSHAEIARLRGEADSFALRLRYHDEELHAAYRPRKDEAGALFDVLEQVRFEAIGARRMAGVAANLSALIAERHCGRARAEITHPRDTPPVGVIAILACDAIANLTLPKPARRLLDDWRPGLEVTLQERLDELARVVDQQEAFARVARELIADLGLEPAGGYGKPRRAANQDAAGEDGRDGTNEDGSATAAKGKDLSTMSPQSSEAGQEDMDAGARAGGQPDMLTEGGGEDPGGPTRKRGSGIIGAEDIRSFRIAYTTEFDEIVFVEDLCDAEELRWLRREMDAECAKVWRSVGRLVGRLQQAVMASGPLGWESCADEGLLDTARLAAVIADPVNPLVYKVRKDLSFRDTVVSLLVDNSGSMKGDPIKMAAITADIVAQVLERCGVWVEVLGFTTRAWKGGQTYEQWRRDGMPANPGRLNDLRHIIYKAAGAPWRRTRRNLGLMLKDDLLKENVDGEAIMWAHERLMRRAETRRILIVISDGEPVDNVTAQENSEDFLARHLRSIAAWIEARSPVELLAIGIEHDVRRYYPNAIVIEDQDELCDVLLDELAALLEGRSTIRPAAEPQENKGNPSIILPELCTPSDLDQRRPRASYFY